MNQNINKLLTVAILLVSVSSCKVVRSTQLGNSNTSSRQDIGFYALPKNYLLLTFKKEATVDAGSNEIFEGYKLKKDSLITCTDADRLYKLSYHPVFLFKDDLSYSVTDQGLMSKFELTTKDETASIVKKISQFKFSSDDTPEGIVRPSKKEARSLPEKLEVLIDFEQILSAGNFEMRLSKGTYKGLKDDYVITVSLPKAPKVYNESLELPTVSGIYYKPKLPVLLTVDNNGDQFTLMKSIFNYSPVLLSNVRRSFFIEKKYTMIFSDGMLKEYNLEKPSTLSGFIDIPLDILSTLIGMPAQVIQIKINNIEANKQLLEVQKQLIEAKKLLRKQCF